MMAAVCPFCRMKASTRQICSERFVEGGIPFACVKCGGGYFQRFKAESVPDEYWEGDAVNEKVKAAELSVDLFEGLVDLRVVEDVAGQGERVLG